MLPSSSVPYFPTEDGGLIVASQDGVETFDFEAAAFAPFAQPEPALPENRLNEPKVDRTVGFGSARCGST